MNIREDNVARIADEIVSKPGQSPLVENAPGLIERRVLKAEPPKECIFFGNNPVDTCIELVALRPIFCRSGEIAHSARPCRVRVEVFGKEGRNRVEAGGRDRVIGKGIAEDSGRIVRVRASGQRVEDGSSLLCKDPLLHQ